MTDERLHATLRSMQPEITATATEDALHRLHAVSAGRRRRQRRLVAAVGAAAATVLLAGAVAVLRQEGDEVRTVVVDQPTTTSSFTSTTTTSAPEASPVQVRTIDDVGIGVTGLELRTWWMDGSAAEHWDGFWRADPETTAAVAGALLSPAGVMPRPEHSDLATMRLELVDGSVVFVDVDLESGWVESGRSIPPELVRTLRTGFNDAVGVPWSDADLSHPSSPVTAALSRISFPITDLEEAPALFHAAFEAGRDVEYERWFVELLVEGHGPVVEVRHRGLGDDSSNGTDHRFTLVEGAGGWEVGGVATRHLCLRSTPGPPPMYACL